MTQPLGIYIHIPFCRSKCAYCDFCSVTGWDDKLLDRYCKALETQMEEYFALQHPVVDTVYFGGGTPSVLGGRRLARLLDSLRSKVRLLSGAEITVEVNPESCDAALFKALKRAGVNRISMGVQSADDGELRRIGRIHTFAQAAQAVELCRQHCTDNISLDIIYALPGQTLEKYLDSLDKLISLSPKHISAYALKVEEGTPLWRENPELPDEDTQADMYLETVRRLEQAGWQQYEISNFAKPGFHSRHNSRYWDLSPYLGLGCAAHSWYGGQRFQFTASIPDYVEGVLGRRPILEEQDELAEGDRHGEYVMLRLRTCAGIDPLEFRRRFNRDFAPYAARLEKYRAAGYTECLPDGRWRLTPTGFLVSNPIIADVVWICRE